MDSSVEFLASSLDNVDRPLVYSGTLRTEHFSEAIARILFPRHRRSDSTFYSRSSRSGECKFQTVPLARSPQESRAFN